jgi:hypothetical protein
MNAIDRKIARRVQAVEQEVPQELEQSFLEALGRTAPETGLPLLTDKKRNPFIYGTLAAAVTLLLVALMMVFYLLYQQGGSGSMHNVAEAEEVMLQDTYVEDQPAATYIVNAKDPEMIVFWVEKINNAKINEKERANEKKH